MNDIELCGEPEAMVVAFRSKTISVYKVADEMTKKGRRKSLSVHDSHNFHQYVAPTHPTGWNLNTLQHPPAVHICCTLPTVPVVDQFLRDLEACVTMVKADPAATKDGMGAIYGMAASIPDKSLVVDIAKGYLDVLTKI